MTGTRARTRDRPQRPQQPEAVEPRHHHVGEHQVRARRARRPAPPRHRRRLPRRSRDRAAGSRTRACRRCRRPTRYAGGGRRRASARRRRPPPSSGRPSGQRRRRAASARPPPRNGRRPNAVVASRAAAPMRGRRQVGACPSGSSTVKVLPAPATLSRRPFRREAWPAPGRGPARCRCPRASAPRAPSMRWKRSKMCGSCSSAIPVPVSWTDSATAAPALAAGPPDLALERELEGVGEQVQDDLLAHVAVHDRPARRSGAQSHDEAHPGRLTAERNVLASSAVKAARSVGS